MIRYKIVRGLSALLLGIAYFSCLLQWAWLLIVGLPQLIKTGVLDGLVNTPTPQPVRTAASSDLSPATLAFVGIVTLVFLVITAIVLIRLPKAVTKTGQRAVGQATELVVPAVTHHKKIPAKKRRELSRRITLLIQIAVTILPFLLSLLLPPFGEINRPVILTMAGLLASVSFICFSISWLIQPNKSKLTSRTR